MKRPEIDVLELSDRLGRGETLVVLDVRRPEERVVCSIPVPTTALDLHVPIDEVPARVDELRSAVARGPLVVYCHHGVRSRMVADWLDAQGLPGAINLRGGIDAWSRAVDQGVPRY